jgi:AcrR family transcriptional regulator
MSSRTYSSPVREAAKQTTRDAILQGLVGVVLDDGVHRFTMQNVANKAGVSLRTVYRHFDSREALLDGLSADLDARIASAGMRSVPPDLDYLRDHVEPGLRQLGQAQDRLRAYVIISIALGRQASDAEPRTLAIRTLLRAACANLPDRELDEASVMLRHIAGSRTWFSLTEELQMEHPAAARVSAWAVRALLDDLVRRHREASSDNGRS